MGINNILIMIAYSFGMACGQILFKFAAASIQRAAGSPNPVLAYINVHLILGLALYFGLTILWVWMLRVVPLSQAYPFVALSFVFTPVLAFLFFGENLSVEYFVGLALIAAGIVTIARQ